MNEYSWLGITMSTAMLLACGGSPGTSDDTTDRAEAPASVLSATADFCETTPGACGIGDGSDVITLGDSALDCAGCIPGVKATARNLEKRYGHTYRKYDVSGARATGSSPLPPAVSLQYEAAKLANDNIKTVIITAGANDILQQHALTCIDSAFGDDCKKAVDGLKTFFDDLLNEFATDGIKNVVYVAYLYGAGGGQFNKVMDYAMGLMHELITNVDGRGGVRVKMVDPRPYQKEHPNEITWLCFDQTHPTADAATITARLIGDTLEQYDIRR